MPRIEMTQEVSVDIEFDLRCGNCGEYLDYDERNNYRFDIEPCSCSREAVADENSVEFSEAVEARLDAEFEERVEKEVERRMRDD